MTFKLHKLFLNPVQLLCKLKQNSDS